MSLARCSSKQNSCAGSCPLRGKNAFLLTHSTWILFLSHRENSKQAFVKGFDTLFLCHILILAWVLPSQCAPQGLSLSTAVFFDHAVLMKWNMGKEQTNKQKKTLMFICNYQNITFVLGTPHSNCCYGLCIWLLLYMQKVCPSQWHLVHVCCVCLMVLHAFHLLRKWKHGRTCCTMGAGRKGCVKGSWSWLHSKSSPEAISPVLFPRHPCPVKSRLTEVVLYCVSMASLTFKFAILHLTWPRPFFPTLLVHRSAG